MTQQYLYWHPGFPGLKTIHKGCETYCYNRNIWVPWNTNADPDAILRWPVPDHIFHAHHFCLAFGISIPEDYEVIDWRVPNPYEQYLEFNGIVYHWTGGDCINHPILRKVFN
jgi:hypothetical protein